MKMNKDGIEAGSVLSFSEVQKLNKPKKPEPKKPEPEKTRTRAQKADVIDADN